MHHLLEGPAAAGLVAAVLLLGPDVVGAQVGEEAGPPSPGPDSAQLVDAHDLVDHPLGWGRALVSDGWASVGAPFRVRGPSARRLAAVVGIGGLLFVFDEPVTRALERSAEDGLGRTAEEVGTFLDPLALMGETNRLWFAGMVVSDLAGNERLEGLFKELLFSHWLASLTRKGIGRPIGRMRPEQVEGAYEFTFLEGSSFPSGHASTITQVAAVLSHHVDRWPATVLLYGMAAAVVYERVTTGKHWASDSWLGAAWGWGVARLVIARREAFRDDFVPLFDPATGTAGVRVALPF